MLIRLFGKFRKTFVLEVRSSQNSRAKQPRVLAARSASSFLQPVCAFVCDRSRCLCASESACCLDGGDTTAPSTHKNDNAMQYRILFFFFCWFVRAFCGPLVFTDSGCFITRQQRCQYTPIRWQEREMSVGKDGDVTAANIAGGYSSRDVL